MCHLFDKFSKLAISGNLQEGREDLEEREENEKRPLLTAIRRGDVVRASRILLEDLAPFSLEEQTSRRDGGPLFWATCLGLLELVEILLAMGASVNATNNWSATTLHAAADNNRLHIARLLLQHGANPNAQSIQGDTPCHLAAFRGNLDIVQCLVKAGARISIENGRGFDVLTEALAEHHYVLAEWICRYGQTSRDKKRSDRERRKTHPEESEKSTRSTRPPCLPSSKSGASSRRGSAEDGGLALHVGGSQADDCSLARDSCRARGSHKHSSAPSLAREWSR